VLVQTHTQGYDATPLGRKLAAKYFPDEAKERGTPPPVQFPQLKVRPKVRRVELTQADRQKMASTIPCGPLQSQGWDVQSKITVRGQIMRPYKISALKSQSTCWLQSGDLRKVCRIMQCMAVTNNDQKRFDIAKAPTPFSFSLSILSVRVCVCVCGCVCVCV